MIANDDFLNIILRRGKETFYTDVVKEEKSIFDIIHIIDQGKTFENYIKMLCLLNNRFMLETPNKTKRGLLERPQSDIVLKDTVEREKAISNLDIIPTYYSTNLDDYLRLINREKRNDLTWYRGICNVNYSLIPSLYVHLPDGTIPYCFQNALIRQSYDETKKNYHVFSKHEFPSAIRQSLMQHYGVPTNLLDFSTDPLASLYWALNPDNEKDKNVYCSAVVYVFHPHKYQKACNIIQNHHKCKGKKYVKYNYAIRSHNCLNTDYIIKDTSDDIVVKKIKKYKHNHIKYASALTEWNKKRMLYSKLPIPVVVPQKNDRILAQSGTFVAFNMCSINKYKDNRKEGFNYLALENILAEYIDVCKKDNINFKENCFLERIIIHAHCITSIRDTLNNTFNYSRESVYPDLEHQLKNVKETVTQNIEQQ
jgi:hypothetical protein